MKKREFIFYDENGEPCFSLTLEEWFWIVVLALLCSAFWIGVGMMVG